MSTTADGTGRNTAGPVRFFPGYDQACLDAVRERVVIFDGATGTNLQLRDLAARRLRRARPRGVQRDPGRHPARRRRRPAPVVLRRRRRRGRDQQLRLPAWVLAEYGIAERTPRAPRRRRRIATGGVCRLSGPMGGGLDGPGHQARLARPDPLRRQRDGYQEAASAGCSRWRRPCSSSRPVRDLPAGQGGHHRLPAGHGGAGRTVPLQVQVTIELTGRMLIGTEIGAALTAVSALRPDVIGLNCATGPRR